MYLQVMFHVTLPGTNMEVDGMAPSSEDQFPNTKPRVCSLHETMLPSESCFEKRNTWTSLGTSTNRFLQYVGFGQKSQKATEKVLVQVRTLFLLHFTPKVGPLAEHRSVLGLRTLRTANLLQDLFHSVNARRHGLSTRRAVDRWTANGSTGGANDGFGR